MTTTFPGPQRAVAAADGVYAPQADSQLLIYALELAGVAGGRHVLDLCTGSGVVAIAAAELGAASVTAFDICPRAVRCSRANARAAGMDLDVRIGTWARALRHAPFNVVVSNPPYVPAGPLAHTELIPSEVGPAWAWNAGDDGRQVLDPLCESASDLLAVGGTMLLVQSEFAGVDQSLASLRTTGLNAEVVLTQLIPFGPVLSARAQWLESTGRLPVGRREETLVVIRADKQR